MGAPGQHSSDLSAFALHSGDHHAFVAGRLVAHPGDHSSLGPLLDRDALRPGDCPTTDRRCVIGDGPCQPVGEIGVISMKGQELDHRPQEVFDIFGLGLLTASGVGFLLLGEPLGGPLGFQFGTNPLNGRCRCPHAS